MKFSLQLLITLMSVTASYANIVLPSFFSNNMVLQRNTEVKVWGWANPNEEITIATGWDDKEYNVKANNQANWSVTINTTEAGGPYIIRLKGYNEIILNNVMLGEVWICSGQSNMEWTPAAGITNDKEEIAKADYPNIRFFTVPKITAETPQVNLPGSWQVCTPENMKHFSAIGYFFAQKLHEDLNGVPVGIINSSWGGTPAEIWFSAEAIAGDKIVAGEAAKLPPSQWGPIEPGRAWNAMVKPISGYKIAGALWYQGESNTGSNAYNKTLGALITSWRKAWGYDFPFYFVQIAPFNYEGGTTQGVKIRNAQRKVLNEVPDTGMAVISDVGNINDVHPRNKKPVGIRLANMALSKIYKLNKGIVDSPLFDGFDSKRNTVTVKFRNNVGLYFKDKTSALFEIAGADGKFYQAKAKIKNNKVVLTSRQVKNPRYVRYAWGNTAEADLFNAAGLPASSFTSEQ